MTPVKVPPCKILYEDWEPHYRADPFYRSVENISAGQLAIQVPFWHYLRISQGTRQLEP